MDALAIITVALRGISLLASNPGLGGQGSATVREVAELTSMLASLTGAGEAGLTELKAFAEEVDGIAKANRAPTPEEWARLRARSDSAHDRIQAAAEAARAAEEPPGKPEDPAEPPPEPPVVA